MHLPKTGMLLFGLCLACACTKYETVLVTDNDPPVVNNVPAIKIENYVNRIFIDLLGREPLDEEMADETAALREADLSQEARAALIQKLQTSTAAVVGDTSYQHAYYRHLYNQAKVRCLEGVSDLTIEEEISAVTDSLKKLKLIALLHARSDLQNGAIDIGQFFARMVDNNIYDVINMNTFNFVNATFDNLYWRYPTDAEFNAGFKMVEYNSEETLFGQTGSSKDDYVQIVTGNAELYEGLIIWAYRQLLSREPATAETAALLSGFFTARDFPLVQQTIMVTDEYANF